jgi:hypothetical protein
MGAVLVFAGLAVAAVAMLTVFALVSVVLKLALRIILFPLFLLKFVVMGIVMLIVGPVLLLVVVAPLLPFAALAAVVWLIVKATRRPAVA